MVLEEKHLESLFPMVYFCSEKEIGAALFHEAKALLQKVEDLLEYGENHEPRILGELNRAADIAAATSIMIEELIGDQKTEDSICGIRCILKQSLSFLLEDCAGEPLASNKVVLALSNFETIYNQDLMSKISSLSEVEENWHTTKLFVENAILKAQSEERLEE